MSEHKGLRHFAAGVARTFHLWPLISRTGIYNHARRKKYPDTLVYLDVVITECCTLKCRNCSNLMQYYQNPANLDAEEVIGSLKRVLKAVRVGRLKILGGEPFVCSKVLMRVLEYLKEESDRYNEVQIITNGTIVPPEECLQVIKNTPNLKVIFSNYGELSSKLDEFTGICTREGISFDVVEDEFWWDFGELSLREEKPSRTQRRFDGCYSRRVCTTLFRGKLYVCPRQAHAVRLGLVPDGEGEDIDVTDAGYGDPSKLKDAIFALVDRKTNITSCRYCGCDRNIKIPRAVQAERPTDVS